MRSAYGGHSSLWTICRGKPGVALEARNWSGRLLVPSALLVLRGPDVLLQGAGPLTATHSLSFKPSTPSIHPPMEAHIKPPQLQRRKRARLAEARAPAASSSSSSSSSAPASSSTTSSAAAASTSSAASGASLPRSTNIIPLQYGFSDGQIIYSAPLTLGHDSPPTTLNVLVDSGSGDLWLADTHCRSESCESSSSGNPVLRYDAQGKATPLNKPWNVTYIGGSVSGNVYTQDVTFGKTTINAQAFGAALDVDNEQLSSMNVSGILGLSLPSASDIQTQLTGAASSNNTFPSASQTGDILSGLWANAAAGTRMFAVGLQRLPSDGGGRTANSSLSLLGVDPAYISDAERVQFSPVVADSNGLAHHWTAYLSDIVANNGTASFRIPTSFPGLTTLYPTAVFDTAAPLSYAPAALLNAIYGTYIDPSTGQRLGPADSGVYYVPCTLPLNITLSVGGVAIQIHPLDASLAQQTPDTSGQLSSGCIGSFQALDSGSPAGADVVLGAPFLRSAYSVYTCDGVLQGAPASSSGSSACASPQIGLAPTVTNLTAAFDDFHAVRVEGKSLNSNSAYGIVTTTGDSSGLSTGGKIAIGVVVAFVGMIVLFGLLAWYARRRGIRARRRGSQGGALAREKSRHDGDDTGAGDGYDLDDVSDSASHKAAVAALSAKEQARLREAALLHGYVADDIVPSPENEGGATARWGGTDSTTASYAAAGATGEWDTSSRGYVDARRVRRQYLARHPSLIELQDVQRRDGGQRDAVGGGEGFGIGTSTLVGDVSGEGAAEGGDLTRESGDASSQRRLVR